MSEYQYYEFQALDRALTAPELAELRKLSSRAQLTSNSASFTYSYGDFRGAPEKVLEKYFDAMLYLANWGTRQLMFRFPRQLVKPEALEPYCLSDEINLETTDKYVILNISMNKEDSEWIEDEGEWLTRLIPLRNAILQGDYRALYLGWLKICELEFGDTKAEPDLEDEDEEDWEEEAEELGGPVLELTSLEPPVPPNLKQLDEALEAFSEFFDINPVWIEIAAATSPGIVKAKEPWEEWVAALSEAECKRLLIKLVQDEANSGLYLRTELRQRFATQTPTANGPKPRTVNQLLKLVEEKVNRAKEEKRRQAEEQRQQKLTRLAQQEPTLWTEVMSAIQQKNNKSYDEAIRLLRDLRELAQSRNEQTAFQQRVEQIQAQFPKLSALKNRLVEARLIKG